MYKNIEHDISNVIMTQNKKKKEINLVFNIENKNIDMDILKKFNIYKILGKLNDNLVENVIFKEETETNAKILFLFKAINKDMGIGSKYMCIHARKIETNNNIKIICENDNLNDTENEYEKYKPILCEFSVINIEFITTHKVSINSLFKIDINEDLPIYMESLPGTMMKKIFTNLKLFIENLS
jgi:hypothetical protein